MSLVLLKLLVGIFVFWEGGGRGPGEDNRNTITLSLFDLKIIRSCLTNRALTQGVTA